MPIREEIEKLKVDSSLLLPPYPKSHLDHLQTHNEAVDLALGILDKWELVDEILGEEFAFYRTIPEGAGPDKLLKWIDELIVANPGDTIAIYVKRNESRKS